MRARRGLGPLCAGAVALTVLAAASVRATVAPPTIGPTASVRAALDKAGAITTDAHDREAQLVALRGVARELVDTRAMGRRAMGPALTVQSDADQQEFLRLFDELFVRAYLQKLLLFRNPTFRFGTEQPRGEAVVVPTQIVVGADAYAVEYEMRPGDDHWRAADVVVEGVSMTSNYADQFTSLLRDRTFAELLDLMRRKIDRVGSNP